MIHDDINTFLYSIFGDLSELGINELPVERIEGLMSLLTVAFEHIHVL
jgi:hypothetical protein